MTGPGRGRVHVHLTLKGRQAPGGPAPPSLPSLPQQEAQAAWRTQTGFLEGRALPFQMEEIKLRYHARKRLHILILKQTGSYIMALWAERCLFHASPALGTLSLSKHELSAGEDPALSGVLRHRGHRTRQDMVWAFKKFSGDKDMDGRKHGCWELRIGVTRVRAGVGGLCCCLRLPFLLF